MAAAVAAFAMSLVSCGGSKADKFIDDYEKLCDKIIEEVQSGDMNKAMELQSEVQVLGSKYPDVNIADFTPEQKKRMEEITTKMSDAVRESSAKMMKQAQDGLGAIQETPASEEN